MKFSKKVLENGLTILHEERDVPVTTIMLATKFGSAYESEGNKGIAHFIEHLCFKGTKNRTTQQIAFDVEKIGGILNAFTDEEVTAYHAKIPSNQLAIAMEVIFDIFCNPTFPADEVKRESQVICEEIKMYKDHPRAFVMDKLKGNMYEKPFGMFIAGTEETVMSFTRDSLVEIHQRIYAPENSILCVVGKNGIAEVEALAKKYCVSKKFGKLANPAPTKKITSNKEIRPGIEQASVAIGFHFPVASSQDRYAAEVLNAIFGEGMSSKLFTEVREKRGLAYAVKTELVLGSNYGYLAIYVGTDKKKVDEVIKICVEEFHKMGEISAKELADGKTQLLGNKKVGSEGSGETAINLILEEIIGNAEDYYVYDVEVKKVTLDEIKKLANIEEYSYSVLSP
mgnify:CR=1 FL=1